MFQNEYGLLPSNSNCVCSGCSSQGLRLDLVQVVMRQAQTVAQAVVRRPAFGAWSCMGPRRRNVAGRTSTEMTVEGDASSSLDVCMGKEKVDRCILGDESAVNSESLTTSGMTCDPDGKEHKLAGQLCMHYLHESALYEKIQVFGNKCFCL